MFTYRNFSVKGNKKQCLLLKQLYHSAVMNVQLYTVRKYYNETPDIKKWFTGMSVWSTTLFQ